MKSLSLLNLRLARMGPDTGLIKSTFELLRLLLVMLSTIILLGGLLFLVGCSKPVGIDIVSQQSHFLTNNKIVIRLITQSPDQKLIATVGQDDWVRIWDFKTHDVLHAFKSDWKGIVAIRFYGKDKIILVTKERELRLYNLVTGRLIFQSKDPSYQKGKPVRNAYASTRGRNRRKYFRLDPLKVKFSQTARYVAIYTPEYLNVVDLQQKRIIKRYNKTKMKIRLFDFTWPGENLVVATQSKKLEYFSLKSMSVIKQTDVIKILRESSLRDFSLFNNNETVIFTGWRRRGILIQQVSNIKNVGSKRARASYYKHRKFTRYFQPGKMTVDKLNNKIVLHNGKGNVIVYDFNSPNKKKMLRFRFKHTVLHSANLSHDGNTLLLASEQTGTRGFPYLLADANTGEVSFAQPNVFTHAVSLAVHPQKNQLYSAHPNGAIHVWQLETGQHISTMQTGIKGISRLYLSGDGNTILGVAAGRKIFSYNVAIKKLSQLIYLNARNLESIGIDVTNNKILTGFGRNCTKVWSAKTWELSENTQSECQVDRSSLSDNVRNVIYNKSDKSTIVTFSVNKIEVKNKTHSSVHKKTVSGKIEQIRLSHNGKWLAAVVNPDTLYIWNANSLKRLHVIKLSSQLGKLKVLGFSKNSQNIYVGTSSGTLVNYDLLKGKEVYRRIGKNNPMSTLIEGGNGRYLVSAYTDNSIRVRNVLNGKLNYIIEVLPQDQWLIYRPGQLPIVASKTAWKYFRLRHRSSLQVDNKLLRSKDTYAKQLPGLKKEGSAIISSPGNP
ncbi:hypothetical protein MNBD_GAMMA12-1262 [hydrothermal vent metagenome]|uniref:Uncharacterized protein n=1 Tax=hydrothermal vent metagenome TaxID=652676 RepID=A0A3B0XS87_9ZZZZ